MSMRLVLDSKVLEKGESPREVEEVYGEWGGDGSVAMPSRVRVAWNRVSWAWQGRRWGLSHFPTHGPRCTHSELRRAPLRPEHTPASTGGKEAQACLSRTCTEK